MRSKKPTQKSSTSITIHGNLCINQPDYATYRKHALAVTYNEPRYLILYKNYFVYERAVIFIQTEIQTERQFVMRGAMTYLIRVSDCVALGHWQWPAFVNKAFVKTRLVESFRINSVAVETLNTIIIVFLRHNRAVMIIIKCYCITIVVQFECKQSNCNSTHLPCQIHSRRIRLHRIHWVGRTGPPCCTQCDCTPYLDGTRRGCTLDDRTWDPVLLALVLQK